MAAVNAQDWLATIIATEGNEGIKTCLTKFSELHERKYVFLFFCFVLFCFVLFCFVFFSFLFFFFLFDLFVLFGFLFYFFGEVQ